MDEQKHDMKATEAEIKNLPKNEKIQYHKIINEARKEKAKNILTLPETQKIIIQKVQRLKDDLIGIKNCQSLINKLDHKNLTNIKGQIEQKTMKAYINQIGTLYKKMNGNKQFNCSDFSWLNAVDVVQDFIENRTPEWKTGSKHNTFKAIYSILRRLEGYQHLTIPYRKLMTKWNDIYKKEKGTNLLSNKERDNFISWKTIKDFDNPRWKANDRLLFKLYTAIPPRRNKDYSLMKFIKGKSVPESQKLDKNYNYIITNKNGNAIALIYNNYKTKKRYGQYTIDLTKPDQKPNFIFSDIKRAMKNVIKETGIKSGDLLFPNVSGSVNTKFSDRINNLFSMTKKKISVNILRHSFITDFIDKNPKLSDNTKGLIAKYLGHSSSMFDSYRRLDFSDEDDEK